MGVPFEILVEREVPFANLTEDSDEDDFKAVSEKLGRTGYRESVRFFDASAGPGF